MYKTHFVHIQHLKHNSVVINVIFGSSHYAHKHGSLTGRKRYISVMCFDKHVLRSFCGWSVLTTITYNMGICGQKWPNHVAPEYNSKLSVTFLGLGMFI